MDELAKKGHSSGLAPIATTPADMIDLTTSSVMLDPRKGDVYLTMEVAMQGTSHTFEVYR